MKTETTKAYVLGFMFNQDFTLVALIRKNKPEWQAGKLNGIGGKIEEGETPIEAMVREFEEETGLRTEISDWTHFLTMQGPEPEHTGIGGSFIVESFATVGDLGDLRTIEEEVIETVTIYGIYPERTDMIENLPWCIGLAIDCLRDRRPLKVTAVYPA